MSNTATVEFKIGLIPPGLPHTTENLIRSQTAVALFDDETDADDWIRLGSYVNSSVQFQKIRVYIHF